MKIFGQRVVIAILFVFAARSSVTSAVCNPETPDGCDFDVIVIGAGAAGIGAARQFEEYNKQPGVTPIRYKVLESDSDTAGRARAAHWVAGNEGNPLYEFIFQYYSQNPNAQRNLRVHDGIVARSGRRLREKKTSNPYLAYDEQKWSDVQYWECPEGKCDGTDTRTLVNTNVLNNAIGDWATAYECMQEKALEFQSAGSNDYDIGTGQALRDCGWNPADKGDLANGLEWYDVDYESAFPADDMSLFTWPILPRGDFQDKSTYISDTGNIAGILRRIIEVENLGPKIETDKKVTLVEGLNDGSVASDWDDATSVRVTTEDGPTITALKVISTVSVGVLLNNGGSIFVPSIDGPESILDALDRIYEMNEYKEIFFQFGGEQPFSDRWQFFWIETEERDQCNWWQSLSTQWEEFFPGSNTAVCVVTTPTYEALTAAGGGRVTDEQANVLLSESLGKVFDLPSDCTKATTWDPETIPEAGKCTYRIFDSVNEDWYGSYENWKPDPSRTAAQILGDFDTVFGRENVCTQNRTLYIGGSAGCLRHWGYVHAGLWSGYKLADCCIENLRDGGNTVPYVQFCDASPGGGLGNPLPPKSAGP